MVHFRVQKGSTFAFECCSDAAAHAQSEEIQRLFIRVEDLEALQIEDVSIVKRLDLGDVDRMITLCRQHAGVATLTSGFLLLLTPIPNWDNYLRCLVIKSKVNELDAESVSSHSSVRSEGEEVNNGSRSLQPERVQPEPSSPNKRKRARDQGQDQPDGHGSTATEARYELTSVNARGDIVDSYAHLLIDDL